jgi:long-chain acyl-CoA synthetase
LAGLGIQVHNAYGLTEAPLITINRPGRNLPHTVGTPLPETQLSVNPTGEIFVRGPQVAQKYHGSAQQKQLTNDGWLSTGDLGHLLPDGSLVVEGRMKDIIITSWGKNVVPLKIETMLRRLPGVLEAILVGEGRPYCVAILWVDHEYTQVDWAAIDLQVAAINTHLSHPEQVKRWLALPYDLSVETGELTANLKLRRNVILRRLDRQISWLYEQNIDSTESLSYGLHAGKAGA